MEKEPINVLVGRFQPFTAGHYKCVNSIKENKGLRTIVCWVNSDKLDEKHPFPAPLLDKLFSGLKKEPNIADVIFVKSADIVGIGRQIAKKYKDKYEVATWTCGDDRIEDYKNQVDRYKGSAGLSENLEVVQIPRTDDNISATKVRETLLDEDTQKGKEDFKALMPKKFATNEIYNALREQILKVMGGEASFSKIKDWADSITYGLSSEKADQLLSKKLATLNDLTAKGAMKAACKNLVGSLVASIDEIKNLSPEDAREKLIDVLSKRIKLTTEQISRLNYIDGLDKRLLVVESLLRRRSYRK